MPKRVRGHNQTVAYLTEKLKVALPILSLSVEPLGPSLEQAESWPAVTVDVSNRSDLADLIRLMGQEQDRAPMWMGENKTEWKVSTNFEDSTYLTLDVWSDEPAKYAITLIFNLSNPLHAWWCFFAESQGRFFLTAPDWAYGLTIYFGGETLDELLLALGLSREQYLSEQRPADKPGKVPRGKPRKGKK